MTPDTCPYCGTPRPTSSDFVPAYAKSWRCGTLATRGSEVAKWRITQSPECARYVRVRISHLRRMAEDSRRRIRDTWLNGKEWQSDRFERLWESCLIKMRDLGAIMRPDEADRLRQIDRLRGAR